MKVRALCAAGLVIVAAAPATALAGSSIRHRLHRADVALTKAQDAADDGNEAKVLSSLRGANRQTALALKATLRLVARDRVDADIALADTAGQLDENAQGVTDMLGGASDPMVTAIGTTLTAVESGRAQILTTIQSLDELKADWADALTSLADDAVNELTVAADNYDGLSADAENMLDAFVSHETDAAGAILGEVATIAEEGDAALDGDLLETLESDIEDAIDALGDVSGTGGVVTRLEALLDVTAALAEDAYGYWDDEDYWEDDQYWDDESWSQPPPRPGPYGWDDDGGFRPRG